MIIIICGGIGSGKSLTCVKEIVDRGFKTFVNFELCADNIERLRTEHLFNIDTETSPKGKITKTLTLNYDFWKKLAVNNEKFDIALDEFHNVMNSRRAMSKRNVILSDWLAQIRKILGQSEINNLYIITQKLRRVDVNVRDLAHQCILCQKVTHDIKVPTIVYENKKYVKKNLPYTIIYKHYFKDAESMSMYENFGMMNGHIKTTRFFANPYFRYYNSYELVDFGNDEYV